MAFCPLKYSNYRRKSWLLLYFIVFVFSCIGAYFIESSLDYGNYLKYFGEVRKYGIATVYQSRMEPFFGAIICFFTNLVMSNFAVFMLCLIVSIFIKIYILSLSRLSVPLYVLLLLYYAARFFPVHEMTQIRISLSIGFFMIALQFFRSRFSWIFLLLACLTHYSSLAVVPLFFIIGSAYRQESRYKTNEILIWMLILTPAIFILFKAHNLIGYLTPYFTTLQMYSNITYGENNVNPLSLAMLLDILALVSGLALWRQMLPSTRMWLFVQVLGLIIFYAVIDFPVIAFRLRELYSVLWVFYLRDALEYQGAVKSHAFIFILICTTGYSYLYFMSKISIFVLPF
jgi:hypothetical protein